MTTHKKAKYAPDSDQPDDELTNDQVKRIFKSLPKDYHDKLEELGFEFIDDDEFDKESQEEAVAKAQNSNQRQLVSFFNGEIALSQKVLELFLEEKRRPKPNYPLFRKYFKSSNENLYSLIIHGLQRYPLSDELLSDLAYYHEFKGILRILVDHYINACQKQENLEVFSGIVQDFYYATALDGFDAFQELRGKFLLGTRKRAIIDFIEEAENTDVDKDYDC